MSNVRRPSSFESPDDDPEGRYMESPPPDAIETCEMCQGDGGWVYECEECGGEGCDCCVWFHAWYECEECDGEGIRVMPYAEYRKWKREI